MTDYCFSHNGEIYIGRHASREEALNAGRDYDPEATVWTGIAEPLTAECFDSAEWLADMQVERMREIAYEKCGDASESWMPEPDEQLGRELFEAVARFLERDPPNIYSVVDVVEHPPGQE